MEKLYIGCDHQIGCEWFCEQLDVITEYELCEHIKSLLKEHYKVYLENIDFAKFNFERKEFFNSKIDSDYEFEFFNYCPLCGEKIKINAIKKRISERLTMFLAELKKKPIMNKLKYLQRDEEEKEQEENNSNLGYVYLIKMGDSYKIGISRNPEQRLKEFTKLPYPLEQICMQKVNNYYIIEEELHNKFVDKRKRGEWFDLNESDIDFIKSYLEERKVNE